MQSVDENQFLYFGRWVDKDTFRAFVFSKDSRKLVESYDEYVEAITSGIWFDEKPELKVIEEVKDVKEEKVELKAVPSSKRKLKDGTNS